MGASKGPESKIVRSILDWGRRQGAEVQLFRNQAGVVKTGRGFVTSGLPAGTSDIVGYLSMAVSGFLVARWVSLEVKQPGQRCSLSEAQKEHLRAVRDAGGVAAVVCSLEEAKMVLASPPFQRNPAVKKGEW